MPEGAQDLNPALPHTEQAGAVDCPAATAASANGKRAVRSRCFLGTARAAGTPENGGFPFMQGPLHKPLGYVAPLPGGFSMKLTVQITTDKPAQLILWIILAIKLLS